MSRRLSLLMRFLFRSLSISFAFTVSASTLESPISEDTTAFPSGDQSSSAAAVYPGEFAPGETSNKQTTEGSVPDLTIVAMDPALGEFMAELIFNIEKAIDTYALGVALAEASMEADISFAPGENPTNEPTDASSTENAVSVNDGSAEATTPASESSSSTPVAV